MVAIFPKLCLWRRSLCSNLGGIDPEKLYRATLMYVTIDFQDGVNDFDVRVNESIFFSFACPMTHINAQKCY